MLTRRTKNLRVGFLVCSEDATGAGNRQRRDAHHVSNRTEARSSQDIRKLTFLVSVLMCVMMTVMTVGHIAAPLSAAARSAGAASILFNGIDAPLPKTSGLKGPEVSASQNIVLWNVNFTYPTRPKTKVLDELKLIIPAGKVTAIVGPSGSGKSTIVGLIERWYELDGDPDKNKLVGQMNKAALVARN